MPGELLEFYGLREHPFGVAPNPRYLYPSAQHREALATLTSGIENFVGFSALIAEPGAGKTAVLRELLRRFKDRTSAALISNTQCNGLELLRHIVMSLQIPGGESEQDPVRLYHMLNAFASERQHTKPVVIIIDEAQNLEPSALETLRLLSNYEVEDRKLLHIILTGQPELRDTLRSHSQLFQRITVIARLGRLSPEETEECIAFRLQTAGYKGPHLFSDDAMAMIKQASRGVPREINRICLNALDAGFALRKHEIGIKIIKQVLSDLDLDLSDEAPSEASRGRSQRFETALPRVSQTEPSYEIPAETKGSEIRPDAWALDPFVDIGLGDEVIESVLSGLDPSNESQTATSTLQTTQFETEPQVSFGSLDSSDRPRISYADAGVGPSDDEIRELLSGMDLNVATPQKPSKGPRTEEDQSTGIEPRQSKSTLEPKLPDKAADPRVLQIFAPRKPSEVPVRKIDPENMETPPQAIAFRAPEDPWVTGVPMDPWGRSGSFVPPPPETPKEPANVSDPAESKSRRRINPIVIWTIVLLAALLLLYFAVPHLTK